MSACKHYNQRGLYRCALENQIPCAECEDYAAAPDLPEFQTNAIDADTMLGTSAKTSATERRCDDCLYGQDDVLCHKPASKVCFQKNLWAPIEPKPTEDTIIPDTDMVNSPAHYAGHYPFEVKEVIALVLESYNALTTWEAYCLGNELKYRLRAGLKGDAAQDIAKAMKYSQFRNGE